MTVHKTVILAAIGQSLMWTTSAHAADARRRSWLHHCAGRHERLEAFRQGIVRYFRAKIPPLASAISSSECGSAAATSHL